MDDKMDLGWDDMQPTNEYQDTPGSAFPSDLVSPYYHFLTQPSAYHSASFVQPTSHARSIFSSEYSRGTPASSVFNEDFVSQISQDIQEKTDSLELDELYRLRNVLQKALSQVDTLIAAMPPDEEAQQTNIVGSHVCLFDLTFWDQEIAGVDVGFGYSFARQNLACLDTFIGGPVWVLSSKKLAFGNTRLMLSLTVEDPQVLWGPMWMIGGSEDVAPAIRTERGYVVPVYGSKPIANQVNGIPCHWTEELPDHLLKENLRADCIQISKKSRLVIGLDEQEHKFGITVNTQCRANANYIRRQHAFDLRLSGTSKAYYIGEGYEVSVGGGYNFNLGVVKKWKRMPARTHKSMLISYCTSPDAKLLPVLKMRVGLEVSGCTGNSRRISLWDAIQLLRVRHAATGAGCTQAFCDHFAGSIECIKMCWNRQSGGPLDNLNNKSENGAFKEGMARREVLNAILTLQYTGVDHEGCLQAFWPFSDCPQVCRIKAPLPTSTSDFSLHLSLSQPQSLSSSSAAAIMKFSVLLLLSVMSSAMAQQTIPSLELDEIHDAETLDWLEATSSIEDYSLKKRLKRCGKDSQCSKGNICARFFCVKDHPSLYPNTYCRTNKDCKNNGRCVLHVCAPPNGTPHKNDNNSVHCSGNTCIDDNYIVEADDVPASNAASANRRLTRRSALSEDDKLNARDVGGDSLDTRQLICHNYQECCEPGQPGEYCNHGICVADPPVRNTVRDFLESRHLVCHNDSDCREPGQPGGYCWNSICLIR
ncbi:hypothetical protein BDV19DRAFT_384401 [Aspergillus venezuelensis]